MGIAPIRSVRRIENRKIDGFTLVELMIALLIAGVLTSIAVPMFRSAINKTKFQNAKRDILEIQVQMERYSTHKNRFSLALNKIMTKADPRGNPYQYLEWPTLQSGRSGRTSRSTR